MLLDYYYYIISSKEKMQMQIRAKAFSLNCISDCGYPNICYFFTKSLYGLVNGPKYRKIHEKTIPFHITCSILHGKSWTPIVRQLGLIGFDLF